MGPWAGYIYIYIFLVLESAHWEPLVVLSEPSNGTADLADSDVNIKTNQTRMHKITFF